MKAALLSALLFSSALHAATPPPECVAASQALNTWITQQHGQVRLSDLETSPYADDVRMACDGTAAAYQKTLVQIMQPWQITPATTDSFTLSETAQALLGIAFIIGLSAVSSSAVIGIYNGASGIAIFASDDDISNR